jgi:hypothetical protein
MSRYTLWLAAVVIALTPSARAQTTGPKDNSVTPSRAQSSGSKDNGKDSGQTEARLQFHAAQAALFSALAHASALVEFSEISEGDMDMARSYVHTVNRAAQACDGDSVKVGQAAHSAEKRDSMKTLRSELAAAMKAIDEAQNAVDGHGTIGPHAKNASAHLEKAMIALLKLGGDLGAKPLPAPGAKLVKESTGR